MSKEQNSEMKEVPWEGTLFNMGTMVRDRIYIGHVVREADDVVVVFSDTDNARWDIPKKYIKVVGKNVFFDMDMKDVWKYQVSKDTPLPPSVTKILLNCPFCGVRGIRSGQELKTHLLDHHREGLRALADALQHQ